VRDANDTVATYTYDRNDRLETVSVGGRLTRFAYEPGSDLRQMAAVDGVTTTWTYDAGGRPWQRTDVLSGQPDPYVQVWTYDDRDNLETVTYATGRVLRYHYDAANRISRLEDETRGTDLATQLAYEPTGALIAVTTGNGVRQTVDIDSERGWPTAVRVEPPAEPRWTLTYDAYDGVGNVRTIGDSRPGMTQSFGYDVVDRLTRARGPYGEAVYAYDVLGNRQSNATGTYTYVNQRLTQQNGQQFTYDNAGQLRTVSTPAQTYTYTPDHQLASSTVAGATATYRYDADGWRIANTANGVTSVYTRGVGGQLMTELRGAVRRDYLYLGGVLLGTIVNRTDE
jgi:YD repeat-containing protein